MKRTGIFLWSCIFFCFQILNAQQLNFETLNTKQGLSSNEITCIYEDHEHFLWIGTRDGLNKFDGRIFTTFRHNPADSNSLSGNYIVSIIQDEKHIFWIATKDGGLTRYNEKANSGKEFKQFKNDPNNSRSIATNRLNCLYNWDENYLAIGAEVFPGIFLNKKTLQFTYWNFDTSRFHPNIARNKLSDKTTWIHYMLPDGNDMLFSILNFGYVFKVNKSTGAMQKVYMPTSVTRFVTDKKNIWMTGWANDIFYMPKNYRGSVNKFSGFNDELTCIANASDSSLLVGSRSSGVFLVNKTSGQFSSFTHNALDPGSLPSNKITCIVKDSRGIIWVGTLKGLAKYNKQTWKFTTTSFPDAEFDGSTLCTYRFADGDVAVNTSKGMFLGNETQRSFTHIQFSNRGGAIIPDCLLPMDQTDFLMGTENGFFRWQKGSKEISELSVNELNFYYQGIYQVKEMIYDSVQGAHGAWLAVLGYGLAFYSFDDGNYYQYSSNINQPNSIGSSLVRKISRDSKGNIWVATARGLSKRSPGVPFSKNIFTNYIHEPGNRYSLPANDVTDVWCSRDNHIWVSMAGGGLAEFDGKKFIQYLPESTLSSKIFLGMHIDNSNRIWIITKNGLEVFDRKLKKFFHLSVNDGNANTNLSAYFSNEADRTVSFTSGNKLFSFKPDNIQFSTAFPPLYLTDMNVFGKSYRADAVQGAVQLKSRERYVNFTVSALQFDDPEMVRFQYRLEGMEDEWSNSTNGEIKYTNLPWGHYKLMVRVTNPAGQLGGEKMLAEFVIATPFYYTWWFISLCIAFVAIWAFGFYRYRISQLTKLQAIRNKIARDLHDDIGSTLGSISVFSEAAKQLMEQEKGERAKAMLVKIGDTSREMIENMSDIVWSVNPKNDTAKHLVDRMRVFAGDLVASSEIQLHFNAAEQAEEVKLTMEQRKNIFLIFKETVYNSVKYSGCHNLNIDIKRNHKNLTFVIQDDGHGFDVNNYISKNGNGLKNMRFRAEEVNARFHIQSSAGGTTTTVNI